MSQNSITKEDPDMDLSFNIKSSKEVHPPSSVEGRRFLDNYYKKMERDLIAASKTMSEGIERAKTSRIDVVGQNGGDAEIYHHNHKHGHGSNKRGISKTYASWRGMRDRCLNKSSRKYSRYGGRGIGICDEWKESFIYFLKDMGERPEGRTIDRIDNDGNYSPSNCKWSTPKEQANNTSSNVPITYKGVTKNMSEWLESSGIPRTTFYRRYYEEGKRDVELFKPTIHMRKLLLFQDIEHWIDATGYVNFTEMSVDLGEDRKRLSRVYKEFTEVGYE